MKECIETLEFTPQNCNLDDGGNDIDSEDVTFEKVVSDYAIALANTKTKFPGAKVVVAGIPPGHRSTEIRTKTRNYSEAMKDWCTTNNIKYVENEQ